MENSTSYSHYTSLAAIPLNLSASERIARLTNIKAYINPRPLQSVDSGYRMAVISSNAARTQKIA